MNKTDYKDMWVFIERDGDSVLPVSLELCSETRRLCDASGEKLVAQAVDDRHVGVRPHGREDRARGRQRVDVLGKEHTRRLLPGGAGRVEHHAAGGGADRLRQAQGLADHRLFIQVGVVLVAAFDLLVVEHQGHLIAGERVEAAVRHKGFRLARAGADDATLKLFHISWPPS